MPGTPKFNLPDGQWNHGEGFRAASTQDADYGGYLGNHDPNATPGVELSDIFTTQPWHPYQWTDPSSGASHPVRRFVGYLRPGQLGPYPSGAIQDAAFELFAPDTFASSANVVVAIGLWATTQAPLPKDGGRFAYPGRGSDGLVANGGAILRNGDAAPDATVFAPPGYAVISGSIVIRTFGRPEVFALERARELRQAIELMLRTSTSDPLHPPNVGQHVGTKPPPCFVMGGSFGGLTAQVLCLRWPNEFHGGFSHVFGASTRRVMADQFDLAYLVQRSGFKPWGGAYWAEDTLDWGSAFRGFGTSPTTGWGYFDASYLMRFRRNQAPRPSLWSAPDEDTIGHGTDWLSVLSGTRAYTPRAVVSGSATLAFHTIDKRCHDTGYHKTAIGSTPGVFHPRTGAFEMIPLMWQSWNGTYPVTTPPPVVDDGSEDPYAWVQDRFLQPPFGPTSSPPSALLVLGPVFGTNGNAKGHGLCLGFDESLRFADLGAAGKSLFVGSADGVVSRFVFNPTTRGLDLAARSNPLAYAAFALAVGPLGTDSQPSLVVGTKNRLFKLDPVTLSTISGHAGLDFEHTFPRRLQIADVVDGPGLAGNEIVFTSLLGHLVVMTEDLQIVTDLGEPGIQDFAVLAGATTSFAQTHSTTPVILQSHRGHTAHVTLNHVSTPTSRNPHPAALHAWTAGEEGWPADLEVVQRPGKAQAVVGVYAVNTLGTGQGSIPQAYAIRAFDAMTMQPTTVAAHGIAPGLAPWPELATSRATHGLDLAPVHTTGGDLAGFVVLLLDRIAWVPLTGDPVRTAGYTLDGFPPASRALALTTADLTTRSGGETFREEIVLSTLGGHVVWFHLEDMLANGLNEYLSLPNVPAPPSTAALPYTNLTLAGTWGMLAEDLGAGLRLFAAGQSGSMWEVDPVTGTVLARRAELRQPAPSTTSTTVPSEVTSPLRDLEYLGDDLQSVLGGEEWSKLTGAGPNAWWLETKPWQNVFNDAIRPVFAKDAFPGVNQPPTLRIDQGFVPLITGGDLLASGSGYVELGATQQLHWWGGDRQSDSNLIQGIAADATTVVDSWYTSRDYPATWPVTALPNPSPSHYGAGAMEGKDLRNTVRQSLDQSYQHQSLRVALDGHGPVVIAGTPGGSVVLLRPGSRTGTTSAGHGTVLWTGDADSGDWPADDGFGATGLAVRTRADKSIDIFVGIPVAHLAPPSSQSDPGTLSGGVRWLRWAGNSPTSGTMAEIGTFVFLDPGLDPRGGFGVCGLAVGDVIAGNPGDELVVTTYEGDLFVYSIPALGGLDGANALVRTWVPGTLGACNGIVIRNTDGDSRNELFVAGSQGIWKWRQP